MFSLQSFLKIDFFKTRYNALHLLTANTYNIKTIVTQHIYWVLLNGLIRGLQHKSPTETPVLLTQLNTLLNGFWPNAGELFKLIILISIRGWNWRQSIFEDVFFFSAITQRLRVVYLLFWYQHRVNRKRGIFGFKQVLVNFTIRRFTPTEFIFFQNIWAYLSVFYRGVRTLLLPFIVSVILGLLLLDYYNINFIRQIAAWAVVGLLFFWLFSGFNFFLKRYRFGKFTSAIQRFWKRTNTYFWLIEGFLFSLFFYYYLNSSQEVNYFFDEASLNQTYLPSLVSGYFSLFFLLIISVYSYYIMLNLPNFVFKQIVFHLKVVSLFMIVVFLLECYQFYYVLTAFFEINWVFNPQTNLWSLEWFSPKLRVKHQYFLLALIAKYWHFLFIFFSWLFVIMKCFEQKRLHYTLFGVNVQNCLLLILLNLLFYVGWLKWLMRRFGDVIYFWFFTDYNQWNALMYLNEIVLLVSQLANF